MTEQIRAISYGGGVQSTAMLILAARKEIDYPLALFSNVGNDSEHPATLTYFNEVAKPYAAENGIEMVELTRRGRGSDITLYQRLTQEGSRSIGIPVRMSNTGAPGRRSCTVSFKIERVASYLKQHGATKDNPAVVALGISLDEYQRMRTESGIPHEVLAYPLIDLRMDRNDCIEVIKREGLPVPPKSSCYFCPFHTITAWREMRRNEPELFQKTVELEKLLNARREELGRDPVWFSSRLKPLNEAIGPEEQLDLFPDPQLSCDIGGYCMA